MDEIFNQSLNDLGEGLNEENLRPKTFDSYIGQETIKESLNIAIQAAKKRNDSLDHILLYGPPGLGKTTLAHIIANELEANIKILAGPTLDKSGDLASILTNLEEGDVLFIDEIHRLSKSIEEILYPAMEDYVLDIILGKGAGARNIRIDLPKFTIIGATTKVSSLSTPLRDRFGHIFHLNYYNHDEIKEILSRSAQILKMNLEEDALNLIAERSRKTPRIANRLLKRVRDYAEIHAENNIVSKNIVEKTLDLLKIDNLGLDEQDRNLLLIIIEKFGGGPVGLNTLAAATGEDKDTIENVYEPYLIQEGLLQRTSRGRIATLLAYKHLKINKI